MKKAYRTTVNGIMNPRLRREGDDGGGNYVLKKLGEKTYVASPHEIGWKKERIDYSVTIPDDFAFFAGVSCPGKSGASGDAPLIYTLVDHYVDSYYKKIHVNGVVYQYFESANPGLSNGVLAYYYYAKA